MTDLSIAAKLVPYKPKHKVRFVTATSLFDGHDASINIMRRILQSQGCEVIHLGHNRSVAEVVEAALEEDVQGIAVSSYQGGHVEYFEYLVEQLALRAGPGGDLLTELTVEKPEVLLHLTEVSKELAGGTGELLITISLTDLIEHVDVAAFCTGDLLIELRSLLLQLIEAVRRVRVRAVNDLSEQLEDRVEPRFSADEIAGS